MINKLRFAQVLCAHYELCFNREWDDLPEDCRDQWIENAQALAAEMGWELEEDPKPDIFYAIGYRDDYGAYGMVYGPVPSLRQCLNFMPEPDPQPCYILEFRRDDKNKILAEWFTHIPLD